MPRVSNAFKDYTSIKPLNKNEHNNFVTMLELNSSMFVQTLATARTAKVRTSWLYFALYLSVNDLARKC